MLKVKSTEEVLEIIREAFPEIHSEIETVKLSEAVGRILAEDVSAREDNPPFTRSALDGYAVRAADTFGASESVPAMLTLAGEVLMNQRPTANVEKGKAIYVPTGGCMPDGADAVAMIEITEVLADEVLVMQSVVPDTGVVLQGEDAKIGDVIVSAGQILQPQHIGALAVLGYSEVKVKRKIKCAVIATGDELVPVESSLDDAFASIRDSNTHLMRAQMEAFGCEVVPYGICVDDEVKLGAVVKKAHEECDIVMVSGGSSVGVMDFTKKVFEEAVGAEILMHGIAMKPGKPTILAKANGKAIIGLPGHPVAVFFVMIEMMSSLVNALQGQEDKERPYVEAKIDAKIPSNHGREDFVPIKLEVTDDGIIAKLFPYKSGLIALLSQSDGYIRIPRFAEGVDSGAIVKVYSY